MIRIKREYRNLRERAIWLASEDWAIEHISRWMRLENDYGLGDPITIGTADGKPVQIVRYNYGERISGYPRSALRIGTEFAGERC